MGVVFIGSNETASTSGVGIIINILDHWNANDVIIKRGTPKSP